MRRGFTTNCFPVSFSIWRISIDSGSTTWRCWLLPICTAVVLITFFSCLFLKCCSIIFLSGKFVIVSANIIMKSWKIMFLNLIYRITSPILNSRHIVPFDLAHEVNAKLLITLFPHFLVILFHLIAMPFPIKKKHFINPILCQPMISEINHAWSTHLRKALPHNLNIYACRFKLNTFIFPYN